MSTPNPPHGAEGHSCGKQISPVIDLVGDDEPSDLIKAVAEQLGVPVERLALHVGMFVAMAVQLQSLKIGHRIADTTINGVNISRDLAVEMLEASREAQKQVEHFRLLMAMDALGEALKNGTLFP